MHTLPSPSRRAAIARLALAALLFFVLAEPGSASPDPGGDSAGVLIPTGGNAWVVAAGSLPPEVTDSGLAHWSDTAAVCRFYFRVEQGGPFRLALRMAGVRGPSRVRVTVSGKSAVARVAADADVPAGEWQAAGPGYMAADIQGISRTDTLFGLLRGIVLAGDAAQGVSCVPNNDGNFFYWGRRGPSVHLNYDVPTGVDAEWFYNEVTIPPGQDVIGSFFMADGFSGGYFGMQVNSEAERRVLFSVWSPFATDDPAAIPPDERIDLLRKGPAVHAGEFGSEGSGGQSYLEYGWKAGNTYGFLLHAEPDTAGRTVYTAFFLAPEAVDWRLIASFRRPKTSSYLKGLHSFLENFIPETGLTGRQGLYGNQWVRDARGAWHELTRARMSADNTARKGYRKDYAGGTSGRSFFLKNCGFFDGTTPIGAAFERLPGGIPPAVDLTRLP